MALWYSLGPIAALVVGGIAGLSPAAVRRGIGTHDLMSTASWPSVSSTYVESMLGVLVTAVGFLIVAVVFTYEQQRRSWRLSLDVGDSFKKWLVLHALCSVTLVGLGTLLGLLSVTAISEGDHVGRSAIAATSIGFAGLAQATVLLFISVWMLAPKRLAERIVHTPRGERLGDPAQRLMNLAIIEHRADDRIEYAERIEAISRLGVRSPDDDGPFAPAAFRALLDIAIRIGDDRDPILMALEQCFNIVNHSDEIANTITMTEPEKIAGKLETILADNLARRHPSAAIIGQTLRLASSPGLRLDGRYVSAIYTAAIRSTVFRPRPEDLWKAVQDGILAHVTTRDGSGEAAEVTETKKTLGWLIEVLSDDAALPQSRDEVLTGVSRIRGLLKDLSRSEDGSPALVQTIEIRLLLLLTGSANEHGSDDASGDKSKGMKTSLVRSVVQRRGQIPKGARKAHADLIARVPEPYRTIFHMLAWVFRAQELNDPAAMLAPGGPAMSAAVDALSDDLDIARTSIRTVMGSLLYDESSYDVKVAGYLQRLLENKPELAGLAALPNLIALRETATRLRSSGNQSGNTRPDELALMVHDAEIEGSGDSAESLRDDALEVDVRDSASKASVRIAHHLRKLARHNPRLRGLIAASRLISLPRASGTQHVSDDGWQSAGDEVIDPIIVQMETRVPNDVPANSVKDWLGLTVLEAEIEANIRGIGPQPQYFSEGLVDCHEEAQQCLQACTDHFPDPLPYVENDETRSSAISLTHLCIVYSISVTAHTLRESAEATGNPSVHDDARTLSALKSFARSMTWLLSADVVRETSTRSLRVRPNIGEQMLLDSEVIVAATRGLLRRNNGPSRAPDTYLLEIFSGFRRIMEITARIETDVRERMAAALDDSSLQVNTPAMQHRIATILIPPTPAKASKQDRDRLDRTSVPDGALKHAAQRLRAHQDPLEESFIVELVTWLLMPIPRSMSFTDTIAEVLRALSARAGSLGPSLAALLADLSLLTDRPESTPFLVEQDGSEHQDWAARSTMDDLIRTERLMRWWRTDENLGSASEIIAKFRSEQPHLVPSALAIMLRNGVPLRKEDLVESLEQDVDDHDPLEPDRNRGRTPRADVETLEERITEVRDKIQEILALQEEGDLDDEAGTVYRTFEEHLDDLHAQEDDLEQQLAEAIADTEALELGAMHATSRTSDMLNRLAAETKKWIDRVAADTTSPTHQQRIIQLGLPRIESRTSDVDEYRSQMLAALNGVAHIALVHSGSLNEAEDHLLRFQEWEEDTAESRKARLSTALAGSLGQYTD